MYRGARFHRAFGFDQLVRGRRATQSFAPDPVPADVIQTALKLFLEKSFKAVTFQELMEKTGFSKGAFFHYFKNKQEIFEAAIDTYIEHVTAIDFMQLSQTSLRDFLDNYYPVAKRIRSGFLSPEFSGTVNHYPLMFEAMRILPDFKTKINRHEEKAITAWTKIVAAARKAKEIKTPLTDEQLARLFLDAGHGIVLHLVMTDNTKAIEKETTAAWNNIYRLVKT